MGIFSKTTKPKKEAAPKKDVAPVSIASEAKAANSHDVVRVLIAPHVSEKASRGEPSGTYAFLVRDEANKTLVKEEVERRYKVKVGRVNIVRTHGAMRYFRGRWHEGKITKKALVTLKNGQKIELK